MQTQSFSFRSFLQRPYWRVLLLVVLAVVIHHRLAHHNPELSEAYSPTANTETQSPTVNAETQESAPSSEGLLAFNSQVEGIEGYGGPTPLRIYITPDGHIDHIELLENHETPGFINRLKKNGFFQSWDGMSVKQALETQVDAVSGSTMSTTSIISTLQTTLADLVDSGEIAIDGQFEKAHKGWYSYFKLACSILVLALALWSFFFPKQAKPLRLYLLALSVIVLGFWQGQYLSITHFFNWNARGVSFAVWFIPVLAILAMALPLVMRKAFYCMYVCPFGAAQELIAKLNPKRRLRIPEKVSKVLKYLQPLYLLVILTLLYCFVISDFANFEPFAAFLLDKDMPIVLILAGFFLLLSLFSPKFWCKYCCPTGYILNQFK